MQAHAGNVQHIRLAQRIPGVHHAILTKGHGHANRQQLGHARHAAPLGVTVVPALQRDVDQGVGDDAYAAFRYQGQQLGHIVVVHGVHAGDVRADDTTVQPQALGFGGQGFDVA